VRYTRLPPPPTRSSPSNPFYAASTLPFHAPPFDKIKDEDYQPAIEAGMAEELSETQAIADNPAPPTSRMCLLLWRRPGATSPSDGRFLRVAQANTNPVLQKVRTVEAPKLAAHQDAICLNAKLFCSRGGCLQTARVTQTRSGIASAARGHLR